MDWWLERPTRSR